MQEEQTLDEAPKASNSSVDSSPAEEPIGAGDFVAGSSSKPSSELAPRRKSALRRYVESFDQVLRYGTG